jgi:glycosyltransferase involved in cell wall biosynthesis
VAIASRTDTIAPSPPPLPPSQPHLPRLQLPSPRRRAPGSGRLLEGLSVVLPCFNEDENVEAAVADAIAAARLASEHYEVLVVDDGSADDTARVVGPLVAADRAVRLLVHPINLGYGAALKTGIEAARMPWVLLTDSDLQFDLTEIESFLPYAESSDLVMGYRIDRKDPFTRRANAKAWNWLVRLLLRVPVRDVDCAFKLIRRDLLSELELVSSGATISPELIARSSQLGATITEIGVHHKPRVAGKQSGANPRVVFRAFRELAQLRQALRPVVRAS